MKKHLKFFASLFALLLVASLAVFPAATRADQTNQEKAVDFMEKVLPIDLSKYTITLKADTTQTDVPQPEGYNMQSLLYSLSSENSELTAAFNIEKGKISWCSITPLSGQVITSKQYANLQDAVIDFLKTYQTYTKIDSNNLMKMLDNIDITKNSTITAENTKLTIDSRIFGPDHLTNFRWEHMINGAAYTYLDLTFDSKTNFLLSVIDSRAIYTIGDTSINISKEQAINIALEYLQFYSYEMPDGSIIKDIKASKDNAIATLETARFDYEFRPYWDVRMLLDEVYPGNVFALSAFIWANNGEIIEFGNMATGGIIYPDEVNVSDGTSVSDVVPPDNTLLFAFVAVVAVVVAALAVGLAVKKKRK
ncbi:MAG: hypothetical protein LBC03_01680 [Nitrososphaerota archaeon]|jgi:hypothetical protein|nr:hypothetical protein [Nitrososphaerota archaeon]